MLNFIFLAGKAQPSLQQAKIIYQFTHVKNLLAPHNPHRELMVLEFSPEAALYRSHELEKLDSILDANVGTNGNVAINKMKLPTTEKIFQKFQEEEISIERSFSGQQFIYNEAKPNFNWVITDEEKNIGGFNCRMAVGSFRGRQYHAWFTFDIPISAGPWKLMGLPGLVLDAVDTTGQVKFELVRIENKVKSTPLALSKSAKRVTRKQWEDMMDAFRKNPNAFIMANSNAGAVGNTETTIGIKFNDGNATRQPKAGNPIELTND
ncbi:MAG: GLPGLI family protein [Lacibacter sp.]